MNELDKKTYETIMGLCDMALKVGGLQNKPIVDELISNIKVKEE